MIAYRDTDFLDEALASIVNEVDEIIFVDGAYSWMAPHLESIGIDPQASGNETHRILEKYQGKIRYFNGLWRDELHKRAFGFGQCAGDIIIRIDADEVVDISHEVLDRFEISPEVVGPADFPLMATSNLYWRGQHFTSVPTQMIFFKRSAFEDPLAHCAYLWLVLSEEERSRLPKTQPSAIYPTSVARCMHLSSLRSPMGAVTRARFYILRWIMDTGRVPWGHALPPKAQGDGYSLDESLSFFAEGEFERWLLTTDIPAGLGGGDKILAAADLSEAQHLIAHRAWESCAAARRETLNLGAYPRLMVSGVTGHLDISGAVTPETSNVILEIDSPAGSARVQLHQVLTGVSQRTETFDVPSHLSGNTLSCDLGDIPIHDGARVGLSLTFNNVNGMKANLIDFRTE